MAAVAGIPHHQPAAQRLPSAMDSTSGSGDAGSSDNSATISANDFLTLLVTEMQNQDPTADTDPNEYINQLVNVNSLEQLININQTLSTALGFGTGTTATGGVAQGGAAPQTQTGPSALTSAQQPATAPSVTPPLESTHGNLSVPAVNPAAERLAQSLNGAMSAH